MTTGKRLWIASLGAPQKALRHVRYTRSGNYSLDGVLRYLRPKQHEVDHVQPTQNAVDDCPKYRMVVVVRYRDGKSAAKAHAILRTFDSKSVVAIFVHVAGLSARVQTRKYQSCPRRSNNDHFCAGAANDAKGQMRKMIIALRLDREQSASNRA
jgi:hypothetical protein